MADKTTCAQQRRADRRRHIEKRPRRRYLLPRTWIACGSRTVNGQFYFSELDDQARARVDGLVAVGMNRYGVLCAGYVLMDNHLHCMLRARRGRSISAFMQYLKAGIARLVKRAYRTEGPIWSGPFKSTNLLDDEAELHALRYILRHGVKEQLVADPGDWPLPNAVAALRADGWVRGRAPSRLEDGALREVRARLSPLSRWARGPWAAWHRFIGGEIDRLVTEAAEARQAAGLPALHRLAPGQEVPGRVRNWRHIPDQLKRSRCKTFRALGAGHTDRLALAYQARREGIDGALVAAQRLVQTGAAGARLCDAVEWPAFIAEALEDVGFVALDFVDIVEDGAQHALAA